jgi:hypothetical protein
MVAFIAFELTVVFKKKNPSVSIKEALNDMENPEGGIAQF